MAQQQDQASTSPSRPSSEPQKRRIRRLDEFPPMVQDWRQSPPNPWRDRKTPRPDLGLSFDLPSRQT